MIRHTLLFLLLILQEISAQDRCTTPRNTVGTCINIKQCQSLINRLQERQPLSKEFHDYLISLQCGFEGVNPKVCCEQQSFQTTVTATTSEVPDPPNVANHRNLRLLNDDSCGPLTEIKIFGGNTTGIYDYPWMALLCYDDCSSNLKFRCDGSLINKRYVLTAAHCVTPNMKLNRVRLGEHDLSTELDCDRGADDSDVVCAEKYQDFGIESIQFHPEYSTTELRNDIALIRLNRNADFRSQNVRPICMPIGSAATLTKQSVLVTGWGFTEKGRSTVLMKVQLPLVNTDECKRRLFIPTQPRVQVWYKQICAGGKVGMDSCGGDSGGPLQAPGIYNGNMKYIQYGIVSYGRKTCGQEGIPGVYTKIVYYMDWILDTIRE